MVKKSEDKEVGARIRGIRKSLGLSQRDFAKKIGATPSAVSNWEQGANKPNNERLKKIAELGGIPVNQLLLGPWEPTLFDDSVEGLLEDYQRLESILIQAKYPKTLNEFLKDDELNEEYFTDDQKEEIEHLLNSIAENKIAIDIALIAAKD